MKSGIVYFRDVPAGVLAHGKRGYAFRYLEDYLRNASMPPISLTIPKRSGTYRSNVLFPFFFGLLTEGVQRDIQCRLMKMDEGDYFTRLVKTSKDGAIGAVHVRERGDAP